MKLVARILKLLPVVSWLMSPLAGQAQYKLDWFTIDAGGGPRANGIYRINGTVGQPVTGNADGGPYNAQLGFWSGVTDQGTAFETLMDLTCLMTASSNSVVGGDILAISLIVSNRGPAAATGTSLTFVSGAGVSISAATPSQGACTINAAGVDCSLGTLAAGATATVTLTAAFNYAALGLPNLQESGPSTSTASVGSTGEDADPANNAASLVLTGFPRRDFGDATVPPTCLPAGGRHRVVAGYSLGTLVDAEPGCQPSDGADEDGVSFLPPPPWTPGTVVTPTVTVTRSAAMAAFLDAWLDANGIAGFDPVDRIYSAVPLPVIGANVLPPFTVPATALTGNTWIRFRLSQTGLGTPGGYGGAGEVEDYTVPIVNDPPTVALTSPANGSSFVAGASITLSATASAANGKTIANVQFFDEGNLLGQVASFPYTLVVSNLALGAHALTAKAVDSRGVATISEPVSFLLAVSCAGGVYKWNTASGDWSVAANWLPLGGAPAGPPGVNDTANVPSGTVTVSADVTVCRLNLTGGTINGTATLAVNDVMNWTVGTMSGTGRTLIAAGATLNVGNTVNLVLSERTLENAGLVLWTGTAGLYFDGGAVMTNGVGATWEARNDQLFGFSGGALCRFDNRGLFRKRLSPGTTRFDHTFAFNNYGTNQVESGLVDFQGGGSMAGAFDVASGARVAWSLGTYSFDSGAQLRGAGIYSNSTTITVNSAVMVPNLDLTGTLNGAGTLTVSGVMNWTGGTMSGTGRTLIGAGATLNLSNTGNVVLSQRTLENAGLVLWTGTADLYSDSGAVVTNRAGATWEVRNDQLFGFSSGAACRFDNAGLFSKRLSSGTTTFGRSVVFNNYNVVDLQTGTLQFNDAFNHSGTTLVPGGTVLRMAGGGLASGSFANQSGGRVEWSGFPTYSLNSGVQLDGLGIYTNGGTLMVTTPLVGLRNFDLTGTLNGAGTFMVSNVMNWTVGTMSGTGRTLIGAGATLTVANTVNLVLSERTLENAGLVLWTGTAGLYFDGGAVMTNGVGATWEARNDQLFGFSGGALCRFDNRGIFRKRLSAGTTRFVNTLAFNNYGTNQVESGTLQLDSTYTQYDGQTSLCTGNITNASALEIKGGVLIGIGTISGSFNLSGTGASSPGCSPGRLTIGGNYSQSANCTLEIEIGGMVPGVSFDQLVIGGTATLGGKLVTKFVNGFYPPANTTFASLLAGARNGAFASFSYPSNDVGMQLVYAGTNATIRVINVRPNIPMIADQIIDEMAAFSLAVNATDDDTPAQTLTYTLTNSPAGATVNSIGLIQWTPTEAQGPMTTNVTVRVTDNGTPNLSVSRTFQVTVREVNVAPQLGTLNDFTVNPGQTVTFTATATDADVPANVRSFSLVAPAAGASIDANSGLFTWRPPVSLAGSTSPITVRVVDDGVPPLSATGSFNVTVQPLVPVVLTPLSLAAGGFQFRVTGPVGPDYVLQRSSALSDWTSFLTNAPALLPFTVTDTNAATSSNQFYRALLGP